MAHEKVFLLPGESAVKRTACELATLLGSCVSVTLWHPVKRFSAMNHFMLDVNQGRNDERGKYGDTSTAAIIDIMTRLEPDRRLLQAKIFGGGAVIGHLGSSATDIGARNIAMARQVLDNQNIKVVEEEVGGNNGRRIYMDSMTGIVTVKIIERSDQSKELEIKKKAIASRKIRVLIVDDSRLVRQILCKAVDATHDMEVCGEAEDAFDARNKILSTDPDVVSLDIVMPKMTGLDFLKALSRSYPVPVVICSTIAKAGSEIAQRGHEYGAVAIVDKEKLNIYAGYEILQKEYIPKLRAAAGMVVKKKLFDK